jgi:type IV pilus assembly protein PilV
MNKQNTIFLKNRRQHRSVQQGVALLEALVAILLFSMGVLAVVGLQAAMIKNASDSKFRSDASYIAQQWIGKMWADPDPANVDNWTIDNTSTYYDISSYLPNGKRTVTRLSQCSVPAPGCMDPVAGCVTSLDTNNCPFVITFTWQQPGRSEQHTFSTTFNIAGG